MKIFHIGNPNSLNLKMFIIEFSKMGHQVHTVGWSNIEYPTNANVIHHSIGFSSKSRKRHVDLIREDSTNIKTKKRTGLRQRLIKKYIKLRTKLIINKVDPDIIHGHEADANGKLTASFSEYPRVLTCWGSDIHRIPFESVRRKNEIQKSLQKVDAIHISNEDFANNIVDTFGIDRKKINNISYGLEIKKFNKKVIDDSIKKEIMERYGIPKQGKILLYPAGFRNKDLQNYINILKSFVKLKDHPSTPHLIMLSYGRKSGLDELQEIIKDYNLWDKVTIINEFIPYEVMPYLYDITDITYLIHDVDQLARSIPESMLMGCVPILSKISPYLTNFDDSVNCFFVDQKDINSISETTVRCIENYDDIQPQFYKTNLKWVERRYNKDIQNKKMLNMYESLLR